MQVVYSVDEDGAALSTRAARYLTDLVREVVAARGRARIAVSGGHTPRGMFEKLAEEPYRSLVPWDRLELYWVDERCVPPGHQDSNYRMTREALLSKVPLAEDRVFRIPGELDPEQAAASYESVIRGNFRLEGAEMPSFDLLELGMGPDGHTASLFPHTPALQQLLRVAVANHVEQKEAWRVTLTWPVINQARNVFFLIAGADKAAVLGRVLLGGYQPEELPSQLINPKSGRLTMMLDRAAAGMLPQPGEDGLGRLEIRR